MIINIKNKEFELKYTFRSMMIYEKITGETFQPKGVTEVMVYLFSTIVASCKGIDLTFDEFIDYVDENPNIINDFNTWLLSIFEKNGYIGQKDENGEVIDPKKD